MQGDFSRGHGPDRRRGRRYQRVLLQQGRLLLDSDFNAASDAAESRLREMSRDLGGMEGSPDGGFLISSGPPLAYFEAPGVLPRAEASAAPFGVRLDHRQRFRGRFPSLCVDATRGPGQVRLTLRRSLAGLTRVRLWVRNAVGLRVGVDAASMQALPVQAGEGFLRYEVTVASSGNVLILEYLQGGPDRLAWVGLVEGVEASGSAVQGRFWVTGGRYLLGGLASELRQDGAWPEVSFPAARGFTSTATVPGTYVAYLETWERHVSALEDAGVREVALGGAQDTTTRVEAMGQVKLASIPLDSLPRGPRDVDALRAALRAGNSNPGLLRLESGTFNGTENRLYRFEVHTGGSPSQTWLKWSRHNGSELFPVLSVSGDRRELVLSSTAEVRNGELLEVLSETVDLGDASAGVVAGRYAFTPPERSSGRLFRVREGPTTELGRRFELLDALTLANATLDTVLSQQPGLKVRRWQGLVTNATAGTPVTLEDGMRVRLEGGTFRAGEYWQYEARRGGAVVMEGGQAQPHGPERLFAPLALLRVASNEPAEVLEWWVSPPRMSADRVAFEADGARTQARTVQEALEELYTWQRPGGSVVLEPSGRSEVDDAVRLRELVGRWLPGSGGVVYLAPGVFRFKTTYEVSNANLELRGSPGAVILGEVAGGPALRVGSGRRLELEQVVLSAGAVSGPVLVAFSAGAQALSAHECMFVHAQAGGRALSSLPAEPVLPQRDRGQELAWEGFAPAGPEVELSDCVVVGEWGMAMGDMVALSLSDSVVLCSRGAVVAGDVRLLEAEQVLLDTGLTGAQVTRLANASPELLEATVEQVVREVVPGRRASGVALYARRVGQGTVKECVVAADMGVWVALAARMRMGRNRYQAGDTAVRMDGASETGLEAEEVSAGNVGVHVLAATGLLLESCRVQARLGAVLGGPYLPVSGAVGALPTLISLRDVRVDSCTLEGAMTALHVGVTEYSEAQPPAMELWNVELASNLLRGTGAGAVALSLVVHYPGGALPAVRAHDNQFEGAQAVAIRAMGGGLELSRNRIYAEGQGSGSGGADNAAVVLMAGGDVRVEDNQVELGGQGTCLGVTGCHDVRVARNMFRGAQTFQSLALRDSQQVEVSENDFRDGACVVQQGDGLALRANRLSGSLTVRGTSNGLLAHNRLEGADGTVLTLEDVLGRWQVVGNTVTGGMRLLPLVYSELGEGLDAVATSSTSAVEEQVNLYVQGNCAGELVVGHVSPSVAGQPGSEGLPVAEPHGRSVVQVLSNQAEGRLVVNSYVRCIISHNVAGRLLAGEVPGRLLESNLGLE